MAGKLTSIGLTKTFQLTSITISQQIFKNSFHSDRPISKPMDHENHINNSKRNVEIKAFLGTDESYQERVEIARRITGMDGDILKQRDVFFYTRTGRLKLRSLHDGSHQLIYYTRSDQSGPKLSTYKCLEVLDPDGLEDVLTVCNGARGIVAKERLLFVYENTRIHLDKVKDLGNYLEFEVMLKPEDTVESGEEFAEKLMNIFKIKPEDLITGAYLDLILAKKDDEDE